LQQIAIIFFVHTNVLVLGNRWIYRRLQKVIGPVTCVHCMRLPAYMVESPTGWIFVKFYVGDFNENLADLAIC
jgi:hypothetical protein